MDTCELRSDDVLVTVEVDAGTLTFKRAGKRLPWVLDLSDTAELTVRKRSAGAVAESVPIRLADLTLRRLSATHLQWIGEIAGAGLALDIELTDVAPDAKKLDIDKVLLISDGKDVKIGTPYIDGAKVIASFEDTAGQSVVKGQKLYPMHFRRRKNTRRRIGHRQKYLRVRIDEIKT